MSTLNNQVLVRIPYIQNQLTYNIPLVVYTLNQINDLITTTDIRIQAYKTTTIKTDILPVKIGNELIKNQNFLVSINNTSNGIIITLNQNIPDATELRIRRESIRESATNYQGQDSLSLKQNLNKDFANYGGSIQDNYNLVHDIETQTNKYANVITQTYNNLTSLTTEVASIPRNASQLPATPNLGLTATNTQQQIYEVKTFVDQANKGITLKEAVRVASTSNTALTGVSIIDGITLTNGNRVLLKNQTTRGQNGIYSYNNGNLTRTDDANTLSKIAGAQVQVLEGTSANKEFYCIVNNVNGVLNSEPVIVEVVFNAVGDNQILLRNLAKQPANTIIANITNNTANPTYVNKQDFKTFLEINNINNTADLDKPISTATQTALNLKTNQTDFENLNTFVLQTKDDLTASINQKQNILPIGGEQDYLSFEGNEIVVKNLTKTSVGLENVDNTSDLDKPISITQQEEFEKYLKERGTLPINDLNLTFDLLTGVYSINRINERLNLPNEIQTTSTITLILNRVYLGEQYQTQIQQIFERKNNDTICFYVRSGNFFNNTFTNWERMSTKKELDATNVRIDNVIIGEFDGNIYTVSQVDAFLNAKEDTITAGTTAQYYRGDKQMAELITDAVPEGSNPDRFYFSQPRVRATILNGYQVNSTASTTATDTILQALGKKADLNYTNTQLGLKANNLNPTFTRQNITNFGGIINFQNPDNDGVIRIRNYKSTGERWLATDIAGGSLFGLIQVFNEADNTFKYATIPYSPSTADNSTRLATTQFVNNFAYSKSTTYTKTEVDNALNLKANQSTTYTKTEVDNALNLKANQSTTYTKTEVNNALNLKEDKSVKKFGINLSNKTIINLNENFTVPTNGIIKLFFLCNPGSYVITSINEMQYSLDFSPGSTSIVVSQSFPVATGQIIKLTTIGTIEYNASYFAPYFI